MNEKKQNKNHLGRKNANLRRKGRKNIKRKEQLKQNKTQNYAKLLNASPLHHFKTTLWERVNNNNNKINNNNKNLPSHFLLHTMPTANLDMFLLHSESSWVCVQETLAQTRPIRGSTHTVDHPSPVQSHKTRPSSTDDPPPDKYAT